MAGSGWEVVEADSFYTGAAQCGGLEAVEELIAPIKLGLSRNPDQYISTHVVDVFLAKTDLHWRGMEIVLAHSVWFKIHRVERQVELLWVAYTDPNYGEWEDGDEIPF